MGAGTALTLDKIYDLRDEFRATSRACPGLVVQWRGSLISNLIRQNKFFKESPTALLTLRD
jgi:hypothetical protein